MQGGNSRSNSEITSVLSVLNSLEGENTVKKDNANSLEGKNSGLIIKNDDFNSLKGEIQWFYREKGGSNSLKGEKSA